MSFVGSFITRHCPQIRDKEKEIGVNAIKNMCLTLTWSKKHKEYRLRKTRRKLLSHRDKKKYKVFDIPNEQQRYRLTHFETIVVE